MFLDEPLLMYWKTYFCRNQVKSFSTYAVTEGTDMLTKWSTLVDQNVRPKSIHSQLPVAIFIASETHLGAQKCFTYQKKSKNGKTRVK